ncbi:hypothetical protein LCGC14_1250480, partial [marine sediment metagenome]
SYTDDIDGIKKLLGELSKHKEKLPDVLSF